MQQIIESILRLNLKVINKITKINFKKKASIQKTIKHKKVLFSQIPSFLSFLLPPLLPIFLPTFHPSYLPSFLSTFFPYHPSLLSFFLLSFLPPLIPIVLTTLLPSLLPSYMPSFLPSILSTTTPSFLPFSFLPSFLITQRPPNKTYFNIKKWKGLVAWVEGANRSITSIYKIINECKLIFFKAASTT